MSDLEGWALLCPECLGRAGENPFLRFRLKQALSDRSREGRRVTSIRGVPDGTKDGDAGDPAVGEPDGPHGHAGDAAVGEPDGPHGDAEDPAPGEFDPG
jgi:hypothetical protein